MSRMFARTLICASAFIAIAVSRPAHAGATISYVSDYNGSSVDYAIKRGGRPIAVAPFLPLVAGDVVRVVVPADKRGPLTITLSISGRLYRVDAHHSPFCVGAPSGVCGRSTVHSIVQTKGSESVASVGVRGVLQGALESVAPLFRAAQDDFYSSKTHPMSHRGAAAPPAMPLLETSLPRRTTVEAGSLAVPWLGGQAPFHVQLYADGSAQPIAEKSNIERNEARFDSLNVLPGKYRVVVEDARHQSSTGHFEIVSPDALPKHWREQSGELAHYPASLRAGLLAHEGREWYLAAYQQLLQAPDDYPNVQQLRFFLTEGAQV
jgi:hypothetical protein